MSLAKIHHSCYLHLGGVQKRTSQYLHVLGKVVGCAVVTQLYTELKLVFRITGDRHGLRFEPLKHKGKTVNINTQGAR